MVALAKKHETELTHYKPSPSFRYRALVYKPTNGKLDWCGYSGRFENEYYSYNKRQYSYSKEEFNIARTELVAAYKKIYDIVQPLVRDYMEKKHTITQLTYTNGTYKRSIKNSEKRLVDIQETIEYLKEKIAANEKKLAGLTSQ
jgi:hypothetical protein